ncbi:MAG: hypothetical protein JNG90_19175, partial [Planctomycetaceae bacterium]|nr:hypothetical protein [Planctomycetaceae bacterium]
DLGLFKYMVFDENYNQIYEAGPFEWDWDEAKDAFYTGPTTAERAAIRAVPGFKRFVLAGGWFNDGFDVGYGNNADWDLTTGLYWTHEYLFQSGYDYIYSVTPSVPGPSEVAPHFKVASEGSVVDVLVVRSMSGFTSSVDYTTVTGTAGADDFTPVSGTLTFAPNQTVAHVYIPITDDAVGEQDEFFELVLSNPSGTGGGVSLNNGILQIKIEKSDFGDRRAPKVIPPPPEAPPVGVPASSSQNFDIQFDEAVINVDSSDLELSGSGATSASVGTPIDLGNNKWRFPITGLTTGTVNVKLAPDRWSITDSSLNPVASQEWSFTVDLTPPTVTAVTIASSIGTHAPYVVPTGDGESQLRTVPVGWANRIVVTFSEQVIVGEDDFVAVGISPSGSWTILTVDQLSATVLPGGQTEATWTLSAPISAGRVFFGLTSSETNIRDLSENTLDGDWDDPLDFSDTSSSTMPSGDGFAGGDFIFSFTILPGDANRDNLVDGADYSIWADNWLHQPATFTQADFSGDGMVDGADYVLWADNFLADLTQMGFGLARMASGADETAWRRARAREFVLQLYWSGARNWRIDAAKFGIPVPFSGTKADVTDLDLALAGFLDDLENYEFAATFS